MTREVVADLPLFSQEGRLSSPFTTPERARGAWAIPTPARTPKRVTPRRAIHAFCLECQGGNALWVSGCPTELCEVWHHRRGKRDPAAPRTPVNAIRERCLDCVMDSPAAVRKCEIATCPLHPFRMRRNPNCAEGRPDAG